MPVNSLKPSNLNPPPTRCVLSLDMASKTGWCLRRGEGSWESGVQDFSLKRGESAGMRFIRFRVWLEEVIRLEDVGLIVYEMPHLRGGASTTVLVGLETRVHEVAAVQGIEFTKVHSSTIKKLVTGSGRASKKEVMAWAEIELGRPPIDDNEADAIAMMYWAVDEFRL
jgi:Holliday junction resolvasome RuvABC endonuclease subunit